MMKSPAELCRNQCLALAEPEVLDIVNLGVAPAIFKMELGVVVPMPTLPFANAVMPDEPVVNPPANVLVAVVEVALK